MSWFVIEGLAAHLSKVDALVSVETFAIESLGDADGAVTVVPDVQTQQEIRDAMKRYRERRLLELKEAVAALEGEMA